MIINSAGYGSFLTVILSDGVVDDQVKYEAGMRIIKMVIYADGQVSLK